MKKPADITPDRADTRRAKVTGGAVVLFVALLLSLLHIHNYRMLSPIDEATHFDSAMKTSSGQLVRRGQHLGPEAVHAVACRSIDSPGYVPPPCVPGNVQPGATAADFNISYMHPPLYYAVTGIVARSVEGLGVSDLLGGARFANALWFAIGLLILYSLMGELGLRGPVQAAAALIPVMIPFVVFQSSTVTNDVTAVPSAAFVLLAAVRLQNGRWRAWPLVTASVVAVWLRTTNVFGICVVVIFLLVRSLQADSRERSRYLRKVAAVTSAAAAFAGIVWIAIVDMAAKVPSSAIPLTAIFPKHFTFGQIFQSIPPLVPPTYGLPDITFWTRHQYITLQNAAVGWPIVAAPALAMTRRHRQAEGLALAVASGVMMVAVGPALVLINAVSSDSFLALPFPSRMVMSVVPGCLAAAVSGVRSKGARLATVAFAGAGIVGSLIVAVGPAWA